MERKEIFNSLLLLEGVRISKMDMIVDTLNDFVMALNKSLGHYDLVLSKKVVGDESKELEIVYYGDVLTLQERDKGVSTGNCVKLTVEEFLTFVLM